MVTTRRLRWNLVLLLGGEACAKVLGFCSFAWLGRQLGESVYGDLESAIAIVFGYLPAGLRVAEGLPEGLRFISNPWLLLPVGSLVAIGVVRFFGRRVEE